MKLCKDCKHYCVEVSEWCGNRKLAERWPRCALTRKIDLVKGGTEWGCGYLCVTQRSMPIILDVLSRECGKRGRYWEPK